MPGNGNTSGHGRRVKVPVPSKSPEGNRRSAQAQPIAQSTGDEASGPQLKNARLPAGLLAKEYQNRVSQGRLAQGHAMDLDYSASPSSSRGSSHDEGEGSGDDLDQSGARQRDRHRDGPVTSGPDSLEALAARFVDGKGRKGRVAKAQAGDVPPVKPTWGSWLADQPDMQLLALWLRMRVRSMRRIGRALSQPSSLAWLGLLAHGIAIAMAVWYVNPSTLRAPDGLPSMMVGTTGWIASMGTAAIGKATRGLLAVQQQHAGAVKVQTAAKGNGPAVSASGQDTREPRAEDGQATPPGPNGDTTSSKAVDPAVIAAVSSHRAELRLLRRLRGSPGQAIPLLWLASAVASTSVWVRAALTMGLHPALAAAACGVAALSLVVAAARLRIATDGQDEAMDDDKGAVPPVAMAEEPAGLASLGLRGAQQKDEEDVPGQAAGAKPLSPEARARAKQAESKADEPVSKASPVPVHTPQDTALLTMVQALPGRFKGSGWTSLLDRAAGLLCMIAGIARSSCKFTTPADPTDAETAVEGQDVGAAIALAMVDIFRPPYAVALRTCRDNHAQWAHAAFAVLLLALTVRVGWQVWTIMVTHSSGSVRHTSRTIILPILAPLVAACVVATVGLAPHHGEPAPLVWQDGAPSGPGDGLYGTCTVKDRPSTFPHAPPDHTSSLVLISSVGFSWALVHLSDASFLLTTAQAGLDSRGFAKHLAYLPAASLGMLLTCFMLCLGVPALLACTGPSIGPAIARPLPIFATFFVLAASGRHAVSAWDGMDQVRYLQGRPDRETEGQPSEIPLKMAEDTINVPARGADEDTAQHQENPGRAGDEPGRQAGLRARRVKAPAGRAKQMVDQ